MNKFYLKRDFWKWALIVATLLWCVYIFSNSLQSAELSSAKSQGVVQAIEETVQKVDPDFEISHRFVRKAAHFYEFFVLGILLWITAWVFSKSWQRSELTLLTGLLVAMLDETLQLFSKGRECAVADVWLDFSAVVASHILLFFAFLLISIIKNKKCL